MASYDGCEPYYQIYCGPCRKISKARKSMLDGLTGKAYCVMCGTDWRYVDTDKIVRGAGGRPRMSLLAIDILCPEVSEYPVACHVVDLDEVRDGGYTITVDREFLGRLGEMAQR